MDNLENGSIWPIDPTDQDSIQIREVYARYGLAIYQSQVLEHAMANCIVGTYMISSTPEFKDREEWESAVDHAYDSEFDKTFGNMLRALEALNIPNELREKLRNAKKERDRLAHRFFREHCTNFLNSAGRKKMISECEEAIELFYSIDAELETFIRPKFESHGITEEMIETIINFEIQKNQDH